MYRLACSMLCTRNRRHTRLGTLLPQIVLVEHTKHVGSAWLGRSPLGRRFRRFVWKNEPSRATNEVCRELLEDISHPGGFV